MPGNADLEAVLPDPFPPFRNCRRFRIQIRNLCWNVIQRGLERKRQAHHCALIIEALAFGMIADKPEGRIEGLKQAMQPLLHKESDFRSEAG